MFRSPLPDYRDPCGWNALLPARPLNPRAEGRISASHAVVGAGYTGLAAARRIKELQPDAEVVVLEGSTVGEGSSARNSGFANPRDSKIGLSVDQMERAERLNQFASEGFAYLTEAMEKGGFGCDLERTGRITAAATELGSQKIRSMVEGAVVHGFTHEALDGAGLKAIIGTDYYRAGIRTEEGTCCSRLRSSGVLPTRCRQACVFTRIRRCCRWSAGAAGGSARPMPRSRPGP